MEDVTRHNNYLDAHDLFDQTLPSTLFQYSDEEVSLFHEGFDINTNRQMLESVSRAMKNKIPSNDTNKRVESVIKFLQTLSPEDLQGFENYVEEFTTTNPNMLWNMLHKLDRELYKTPEKFYDWLSTLTDNDIVDRYIYRAADGEKLHSDDMYNKQSTTRVEVLDGYIAVSSSNLDALNRFKDRIMKNNKCSYDHRIKKHGGITIHSYVFNMNKTSD